MAKYENSDKDKTVERADAGARNVHGEESEQSKARRGGTRAAESLVEEGSIADKLAAERKRKKEHLKKITKK